MKLRPGDLIEILWQDTIQGTHGWVPRDFIQPSPNEGRARTVGYFIKEDKQGIVLTPAEVHCNLEVSPPHVSDPWRIPKGCIHKMKNYGKGLQWPKSQL